MKATAITFTRALELAVLAHPAGISSADASRYAGHPETVERMRASALLNQQWRRGKVDRKGEGRAIRYFPNKVTGADLRRHVPQRITPSTRELRAAEARERAQQRAEARLQRKAAAPKKPRVAAPPKPTPAQVAKVSALFIKPTRLKCAAGAETVDEFLARGGVIERLPPGACSRPLASLADDDFPLL